MRRARSRAAAAPLLVGLLASCQAAPSDPNGPAIFQGTLRAGADLGEVKQHCSEGLYLVADEGSYLVDQTTMLLLRVTEDDSQPMYSDRSHLNERVTVTAVRPVDRPACDALICECESFLLITALDGD